MSRQDPPIPPSTLNALSEASFEQDVLDEEDTHLVLFWAEWSKDCMAMLRDIEGIIAQRDEEEDDLVSMGSVNIEANAMLSIQYNIRTLPTLLVFQNGFIQESHEGYLSRQRFEALLDRLSTDAS